MERGKDSLITFDLLFGGELGLGHDDAIRQGAAGGDLLLVGLGLGAFFLGKHLLGFFGSETEIVPKAMLGAARAFRGMDSPAMRDQKLEAVSNRYLYDIIVSYPVSKEAEEAKKLLPPEERAKAEADQKKIAAGGPLPDGVIMAKPKLAAEEKVERNK